jgi:uncharacterized membrane protein YgcG
MKRTILALLAALFVTLLPAHAYADANNFQFTSLDSTYYLSKDSEGRSTAKVTETFVADFAVPNQNHGIERALPETYDSHPLDIKINSVSNGAGTVWNYTTYASNDNLVVRIGDADRFVQGTQTYVLTYTMRDVTQTAAESNKQEFFWNINGTQWQQSFGLVTASVQLDPSIAEHFDGQAVCFTGQFGSKGKDCTLDQDGTTHSTVFRSTRPLYPGENMSVALGFEPQTFAAYVQPPIPWWIIVLGALIAVFVGVTQIIAPIWLIRLAHKTWKTYGKDARGKGTIVPQYTQPAGQTILEDSVALKESMQINAISATYIDLAIRGYLRLADLGKNPLGGGNNFEMKIMKPVDDLTEHEVAALKLMFDSLTVGATTLTETPRTRYKAIERLKSSVYETMVTKGFFANTKIHASKLTKWGLIFVVGSFFIAGIVSFIAGVIALIYASRMSARTLNGVELRDYLLGNKMYMEVAEEDRIRTLQSVAGAERIDTNDATQVVKLYEKLLPLAILFGIEKQWAQQFAALSTAYQPEWYDAQSTTFNAALLGSSLSGFSNTLATSTFAPPVSTSGGGSAFSGGGSSGGGGGGGGGGGW